MWRWGEPLAPLRATLRRGGLLAVPTESTYGLAADPWSAAGVAAVFRVKGRPPDKPLPVVLGALGQLAALGGDPDDPWLRRLAALWPAALTVVVPVAAGLPAAAGGNTLGVRVPDHRRLRELLAALGHGLTATSANRSGEPPCCRLAEVRELLGGLDAWVVEGGDLAGGPPSTIVALGGRGFTVLRPGRYPVGGLRLLAEEGISAAAAEIPADEPS